MQEIVLKSIMGSMLFVSSIQDLLKKKVCVWIITAGGLFTIISLLFIPTFSIMDSLGGLIVGAFVLFISRITGGKIGMGDGLILCVTGLGLGLWGNIELFAYALFAAAIVSIILLVLRLADRKKSIPFIPFLFISYLFVCITTSY
ncbi:MAG: putative rane protein [Herbinix sp.]|jgi:leader peptidase (prepilin peptidase)/N-methyltransferase|nr:putative rane protein [Herbinix sp.]